MVHPMSDVKAMNDRNLEALAADIRVLKVWSMVQQARGGSLKYPVDHIEALQHTSAALNLIDPTSRLSVEDTLRAIERCSEWPKELMELLA